MDDGITTDPWIIANRPNTWVGPATNYSQIANVDDCSCIYEGTSLTTWDCNEFGDCYEIFGPTGPYNTLSECEEFCISPCPPDPWHSTSFTMDAAGFVFGDCANGIDDSNGSIIVSLLNQPPTFVWTIRYTTLSNIFIIL